MTSPAKKHDESNPSSKLLVLSGLLFSSRDAGLLSIEALRTSPVSMAFAVALATAAVATLGPALRDLRRGREGEEDATRTGPVWHESTMFTDPWYQVPAVFCVFILFARFATDLIAAPPATDRAVWFLAGWVIAALVMMPLGLTGALDSKKRAKGEEARDEPRLAEAESPVGTVLTDPWFSVPAGSIAFLHLARGGLETIEKEPESVFATMWLLMPVAAVVAGLATFAWRRARERRKEEAVVVDAGTVGVTGDVGGPEA